MDKPTVALIDGDILRYSVGYGSEKRYYKASDGEGTVTLPSRLALYDFIEACSQSILDNLTVEEVVEPIQEGLAYWNLSNTIDTILEKTKCQDFKIFLTGDPKKNFRLKYATLKAYKGNRNEDGRPHYYSKIGEWLTTDYGAETSDGEEADDSLGIEQCECTRNKVVSVICSIDKDMMMIPGWHYNINYQTMTYQTQEEADWFFWYQMLMGDKVDCVIGVPKIGPKKAHRLLETCKTNQEMYDKVLGQYEAVYEQDGEKNLIENGRLLWIRRRSGEIWDNEGYKKV